MKAMFLLSAVALLSATALAGPKFEGAVSRHISLPNQPAKVEKALPQATRSVELRTSKNLKSGRFEAMGETSAARRAKATTYGAYYSFGDGTLKSSLFWEDGSMLQYSYALAHAFPYSAKFDAQLGNTWTMVTSSETIDLSDNVDSDGNLQLSDLGIGDYYMPTINARNANYTWSTRDTNGQILIQASGPDSYYMGVYDAFECDRLYDGFQGGTYGYGTVTPYGPSNLTLIDIGKLGGPLVVEDVRLCLATNSQLFATEDDYILVTIYDIQENDTIFYNAYIRSENIETNANGWTWGIGKFVEIDEDGFESEVSPVLTGEVEIRISGTEGTDYGIVMVNSDMEDKDDEGYVYYNSRSYWWSDGSASGMSKRFYRWTADDAFVVIKGRFNAVTTYGTPERSATGYVPNDATYYQAEDGTSYTWAVSAVDEEDGKAYNDFDVESTFNILDFSVIYDEDVVAGIDFDTTYFAKYNLIALYVAVKELPQDVDVRTTTVTFISNEEAEYPITITQFGAGAGIKNVAKDAEKEDNEVYNLQGVKVSKSEAELPAGVYVKNGKKFVK